MNYINLHTGIYINPSNGRMSIIAIRLQDNGCYFLSFKIGRNNQVFDLLGIYDRYEYCAKLGIECHQGLWPETKTKEELFTIVEALNHDLTIKYNSDKSSSRKVKSSDKKVEFSTTDLPW